jgi:hypothetical protein
MRLEQNKAIDYSPDILICTYARRGYVHPKNNFVAPKSTMGLTFQ